MEQNFKPRTTATGGLNIMVSDDEWNRNIRKTLKERRPGTTDEEIDLLDSSSSYWGSENYRAASVWTAVSIQLLDAPTHLATSLAFVNLNGLLDDIPKFLKEKAKIFSMFGIVDDAAARVFIATNTDDQMREHFALLWEVNQTAALVRSMVSDDDMFILGFLRHRYCHPILSGYSVKIDGFLGTSKFKVEKWKRLLDLGSETKEDEFKLSIIEKLKPTKNKLECLRSQLDRMSK